jgi:membrane fusion protein (multidrug efflux system)
VRTGTIAVAGLFPNPEYVLRPGQFAKMRAATAVEKGALLVPQRAVTELQGKYTVAVVDPGNKVSIRPVTVGDCVDSLWIIEDGVHPGEHVIAEGILKVKDGMTVNPVPFAQKTEEKPLTGAQSSSNPDTVPEANKANKR